MKSIGIVGFGNMGEAFAAGIKTLFPDVKIFIYEKSPVRVAAAKDLFDAVDCTSSWGDFFSSSEIVILAVKPQDALGVLKAAAPHAHGKRFISIIAGKTLSFYRTHLDTPYIARFMPNLAAMYRKAAVGVSFPLQEGEMDKDIREFRSQALKVAEALGAPIEIPESLMPMITGLSGSGIAFVFSFVNALAMGGVKTGLAYPESLKVALQVVEGAVEVMRRTNENPGSLIAKVASPAGTTIAGLQALEEASFTAVVMRAVEEASIRAKELEGA